ncbi:MAG: tetratricopeptide repeat protein, partial [Anaerolineales bacterium]
GKRAGASAAMIRKIEADERKPSRELAELLARALQIPEPERELFLMLARGIRPPTLPAVFPAASTPQPPAGNLPAPLTSLVNRVNDVSAVAALLTDSDIRWVTLVGPPGIGKTRLSIQSGRQVLPRFADGVWFVDLAALERSVHVLPAVCRALEPFGLPPTAGRDQVAAVLKMCRLLLVLDNFEHVPDAAIEIAELLRRCPGLKVLATSRAPLHIYGEHQYPVPPLSVPPADAAARPNTLMQYESVQLFVARARQHQPGFAVNAHNARSVVEICATLEGIPLALELAAATLRQMTLDEMADLLHSPGWARQLATPARDLPARQRTLDNVMDWSYSLLDDEQQDFFIQLGVFSHGFDREAAAAVCQTPPEKASRLLSVLAEHSLLARDAAQGHMLWRMLELIREYARSKLTDEQRAAAEARRGAYFLQAFQALHHNAPRQAQVDFFQSHVGNLQTSLNWAIAQRRTDVCLPLILLSVDFWETLGYPREGFDIVHRFLNAGLEIEPHTRARLANAAATLAWQQHDFDTALAYAQEAVSLAGEENEDPMHRNLLGRIYIEQGNYPAARTVLEDCLASIEKTGAGVNPGPPLAQLGEAACFEGRFDEAQSLLQRALSHLPAEDGIFRAMALTDLAEMALTRQDGEQAR